MTSEERVAKREAVCAKWDKESLYISSIDAIRPGPVFNNDRQCFARYCAMQVESAKRDHCYFAASDMDQIRFIAFYEAGYPDKTETNKRV